MKLQWGPHEINLSAQWTRMFLVWIFWATLFSFCVADWSPASSSTGRWSHFLGLSPVCNMLNVCYYIPCFNEMKGVWYAGKWLHLVSTSVCPSVNRIVSVFSTIPARSISCLDTHLISQVRMCVACWVVFFLFVFKFQNLNICRMFLVHDFAHHVQYDTWPWHAWPLVPGILKIIFFHQVESIPDLCVVSLIYLFCEFKVWFIHVIFIVVP